MTPDTWPGQRIRFQTAQQRSVDRQFLSESEYCEQSETGRTSINCFFTIDSNRPIEPLWTVRWYGDRPLELNTFHLLDHASTNAAYMIDNQMEFIRNPAELRISEMNHDDDDSRTTGQVPYPFIDNNRMNSRRIDNIDVPTPGHLVQRILPSPNVINGVTMNTSLLPKRMYYQNFRSLRTKTKGFKLSSTGCNHDMIALAETGVVKEISLLYG